MTRSSSLTGTRLGSFLLQERLAAGGFAVVYRAAQVTLGDRPTAVKVLRDFADEPDEAREGFVRDFRAESALIAKLDHESILPVIEAGEDRGHFYIAMRLVEGGSLSDLLKKYDEAEEPFPIELVARFIRQIGSALDCAHDAGIVHRDVKPQNILIDRGNQSRLTDFGISRLMDATARAHTSHVGGTPHYMSPEQWEAGPLTNRSDLYAVGIILFQMLTGTVPFDAASTGAIISMHMTQEPELPADLRRPIGSAMTAVIKKALAKKPEDRFASGAELADAVDRALEQDASSSGAGADSPVGGGREASVPPAAALPAREKVRGGARSRRWILVLAIVGLMALAAGIAWSLRSDGGGPARPSQAAEQKEESNDGEPPPSRESDAVSPAGDGGAAEGSPDADVPTVTLVSAPSTAGSWAADRSRLPVALIWKLDQNPNLLSGQRKLMAAVEGQLREHLPALKSRPTRNDETEFDSSLAARPLALQAWFARNDVESAVVFLVALGRERDIESLRPRWKAEISVRPAVYTRDDLLRATLPPGSRATESPTVDPFGWTNTALPTLAQELAKTVGEELDRWYREIAAEGRLVRVAIGDGAATMLGTQDIVDILEPLRAEDGPGVVLDTAFNVSEISLKALSDEPLVRVLRRDTSWRFFRLRHRGDPGEVAIKVHGDLAITEGKSKSLPRLEKRGNLIIFDRSPRKPE